jgi:hypothetical protein
MVASTLVVLTLGAGWPWQLRRGQERLARLEQVVPRSVMQVPGVQVQGDAGAATAAAIRKAVEVGT